MIIEFEMIALTSRETAAARFCFASGVASKYEDGGF
jgi:hypothetical protein